MKYSLQPHGDTKQIIADLRQALILINDARSKMAEDDYNKYSVGYDKMESQVQNLINHYKMILADEIGN